MNNDHDETLRVVLLQRHYLVELARGAYYLPGRNDIVCLPSIHREVRNSTTPLRSGYRCTVTPLLVSWIQEVTESAGEWIPGYEKRKLREDLPESVGIILTEALLEVSVK